MSADEIIFRLIATGVFVAAAGAGIIGCGHLALTILKATGVLQ